MAQRGDQDDPAAFRVAEHRRWRKRDAAASRPEHREDVVAPSGPTGPPAAPQAAPPAPRRSRLDRRRAGVWSVAVLTVLVVGAVLLQASPSDPAATERVCPDDAYFDPTRARDSCGAGPASCVFEYTPGVGDHERSCSLVWSGRVTLAVDLGRGTSASIRIEQGSDLLVSERFNPTIGGHDRVAHFTPPKPGPVLVEFVWYETPDATTGQVYVWG